MWQSGARSSCWRLVLALLIFSVDWVGFLVIAALLGLCVYGLHRLRQPQPVTQPAPPAGVPPPAPAAPAGHDEHTVL